MPNNYNWNMIPSYSNPPYYNNNYNYLNRMTTPQQQQQVYPNNNTTTTQNNIIWVKGKENARSMQLPPNSTVILLDSEVGKFYIKTTDDIGLGKIRIFSYTEEPDNQSNVSSNISSADLDLSNYVTKEQLEKAIKEIKNEQPVSVVKQKSSSAINKQF